MEIKAVLFDMDGVITDSETYARKSMHETFENRNIEWDEVFYNSLLGINHKMGQQLAIKKFGSEEVADSIMNEFITRLEGYFIRKEVKFKPGALELITYLNEHNFPIALATSGSPEKIKRSFDSNNVDNPFTHIINGSMVTNSKPDPEIFLKAAKLVDTDISNCLVIEDSVNGIKAAINAGSISCLVPDYIIPPIELQNQASMVKKDLFEVLEVMKSVIEK